MVSTQQRHTLIDWLRTTAIALMIIYHFCFDLHNFGLLTYATFNGTMMTAIGRSCLALFMFCVGYSLALSHQQGMNWRKFWQRWLKLAAAAALVSIATYITYPGYWIYFGILHCIALTSLLALPLLPFPKLALVLGLAMLFAYAGLDITISLPFSLFERPSLDFIPPYPWSWAALVGIGAHHLGLHENIRPPYHAAIAWLSQHSLLIYLIHQPILLAIAYLLWRIIG